MRQLKISKSITNRESESLEKYLQEIGRVQMITAEEAAKAIWFLCQQPTSGVISEMVLQPFNHQAI